MLSSSKKLSSIILYRLFCIVPLIFKTFNKNQFRHSVIPTLKKIILPEKKNTFLNFFFKHQLILLCYDPRWLQINFAHHVLFSKKLNKANSVKRYSKRYFWRKNNLLIYNHLLFAITNSHISLFSFFFERNNTIINETKPDTLPAGFSFNALIK